MKSIYYIYQFVYIWSITLLAFILALIQFRFMNIENVADLDGCLQLKFLYMMEPGLKCTLAFLIGGLIGDSSFIKIGNF